MFRQLVSVVSLAFGMLLVWSLPALAVRPLAERRLAADIKHCAAVAGLAHSIALARDEGIPLSRMLKEASLPVDTPEVTRTMRNFTLDIYALTQRTPAEIKQQWEIDCLRERLNSRQP